MARRRAHRSGMPRLPALLLAALAALALPHALAGPPPAPEPAAVEPPLGCPAACAEAQPRVESSCLLPPDPAQPIRCTFYGWATGRGFSKLFLPGQVRLALETEVTLSCTPVPCGGHAVSHRAASGAWGGGPAEVPGDPLGLDLGPEQVLGARGDGFDIAVWPGTCHSHDIRVRVEVVAEAPAGHPALPGLAREVQRAEMRDTLAGWCH